MGLAIEEDFDPIALLGLTPPTGQPGGEWIQERSDIDSHRVFGSSSWKNSSLRGDTGRYSSADWEPPDAVEEAVDSDNRLETVYHEPHNPSADHAAISAINAVFFSSTTTSPPKDKVERTVDQVVADAEPSVRDESVTSHSRKEHTWRVRRVRVRLATSRRFRPGIRIIQLAAHPDTQATHPSEEQPTPTVEESTFRSDFHDVFGLELLDAIEKSAKENVTTGNPLPSYIRDLFPALEDLSTAVNIANTLRGQFDLPLLVNTKQNRIEMIRSIARTRETLYTTLFTALALPLAPVARKRDRGGESDDENDEKRVISLTPTNLEKLAKTLPKSFPRDKHTIKSFMANGGAGAYGEQDGEVVWEGGVGRVVSAEGLFRSKTTWEGDVHVFVDHSNVFYGLLSCLHPNASTSFPPRHLRTLSLPILSLLLRRGRPTPPGTLHLVASSPLKQNLDVLVRLGWEVSILKRVELFSDEVQDPLALNLMRKAVTSANVNGEGVGLRRYKEQGVDEILHLKLLQALNHGSGHGHGHNHDHQGHENLGIHHGLGHGRNGKCVRTIVLATGDARGGQFNRDGFVGGVREALKRGWNVELWSFKSGLSRGWIEVGKRERWFDHGRFTIYNLDEWAEQLVEVAEGYHDERYSRAHSPLIGS